MIPIAKCVGCGLEVNNGILEVALCNTSGLICNPVSAATPGCTDGGIAVNVGCGLEITGAGKLQPKLVTGGGISCDATNGLSIKFPAAGDPNSVLGCGLTSDGAGKLAANVCVNGGLACGTTTDGTNCLYANVQNQGAGPVVPIGTVNDPSGTLAAQYNDCNGLVRTDQGLWAPPKTGMAASITAIGSTAPSMSFILQTKVDTDFPPDHAGANEYLVGSDTFHCIMCFCVINDTCNPFVGITLSKAIIPLIVAEPGQVHRFSLWERLAYVPNCSSNGVALTGTPWVRQCEVTFDEFSINGSGKQSGYEQSLIDHSFITGPVGSAIKGEMCMTYQRFGPGATAGGKPDNTLSGAYGEQKEYVFFVVANHHFMPGNSNQDCRVQNP